ncbi:MAG: hypothetical protein WKF37_18310 [Bryobacteraceae bacterium]
MRINVLILAAAAAAIPGFAQPEKVEDASRFYRLEFSAKEMESGKVSNSRTYTMLISNSTTTKGGSIRVGSKLPVQITSPASGFGGQYQFYDLGVNIDCRSVREVGSQLALDVSAEMSSVATTSEPANPGLPPIVRQNKWSSNVLIPVGKPTVVFASDDLTSKRTIQIEVTATLLK